MAVGVPAGMLFSGVLVVGGFARHTPLLVRHDVGRRRLDAARAVRRGALLVAFFATVIAACERRGAPVPSSAPSTPSATVTLTPGWDAWTRSEAAARLGKPDEALSAAIRLVRLSDVDALCVPEHLDNAWLARLGVVEVGTAAFALGLRDPRAPRRLRAPVLIADSGEVRPLATGVDEELLILHLGDTEAFPHVVFTPDRVWIVEDELIPAIALAPGARLRFEVVNEPEGEVLVLLARLGRAETPVARYTWAVGELAFMGPAAADLPDPPGGAFEIDLERSERLEPVGGRMPAPLENRPPPQYEEPRPVPREV